MTTYSRLKLSLGGELGAQTFSFGFTFDIGLDTTTQSTLEEWLAAVDDIWSDHTTDLGSPQKLISDEATYTTWSAYFYAPGQTTALAQATHDVFNGTGTGTGSLPSQTSLVATLLTGLNGRHNKGRVYVPVFGAAGASLQATSAQASAVCSWVKNFLDDVNGSGSPYPATRAIVPSAVASTAPSITSVRVDSRYDIQRRRANKFPALFSNSQNLA